MRMKTSTSSALWCATNGVASAPEATEAMAGVIVDGGTFDFASQPERYPGFNTPDESYNGIVFAREHQRRDDDSLLSTPKLTSGLASSQRPQADDRLLSRSHRLDQQDDALDEFFAALGDESVDQKEGSELLDE